MENSDVLIDPKPQRNRPTSRNFWGFGENVRKIQCLLSKLLLHGLLHGWVRKNSEVFLGVSQPQMVMSLVKDFVPNMPWSNQAFRKYTLPSDFHGEKDLFGWFWISRSKPQLRQLLVFNKWTVSSWPWLWMLYIKHYTLQQTNIAMEHGLHENVLPATKGNFPLPC